MIVPKHYENLNVLHENTIEIYYIWRFHYE